MLARRRQELQRRGAVGAAGSPKDVKSGVPVVPSASLYSPSHTVAGVIEERLAAFAPCVLPSLINDRNLDEEATILGDCGKDAGEATRVGGADYDGSHSIRLTQALLLMYLHIGTDPPDFPRIEPCAKTECWVDPLVAHVAQYGPHGHSGGGGGCDSITEALERQYRGVLGDDLNVVRVVEASIDVTRSMLVKARRMARGGRVLVHYNGHGMPRATELGEVWMFDKERTHYVPLNISETADLVGSPALYVLDCNSAGSVLRRWCRDGHHERRPHDLFICGCSPGETLPLNPLLPADMLTSCLTTPLMAALEWYIGFSHYKTLLPQVTEEMIRHLPGELHDRHSPRWELNAILNAVTTTIAWCTLPPARFHFLFRHDSATRSLFRNAILADRLMREVGCTPVTHPPLSDEVHLHPLWELWEYTLERAIHQLPRLLAPDSQHVYEPSDFFDNQLTAFQVWVQSGDMSQLPEQLPCVLLALSQATYRVRAFTLLAKYLDSGRTAGKRAILCGILPYLSHLLTQAPEVFLIVTVLWMQVVRADPAEACSEMQRSLCEKYFISLLKLDEAATPIEAVGYGQTVAYTAASQVVGRGGGQTAFTAGGRVDSAGKPRGMASLSGRMPSANYRDLHHNTSWGSLSSQDATDQELEDPQQPLQPAAPLLSSIATHAVLPGSTTYYLMKDIDLSRCKSMACYILCQFQLRGERQCVVCWNNRLLNAAFPCLSSRNAELRSWACLVLARLFSGLRHAKNFASRECASRVDLFTRLLKDRSPIVRSSCVTLLASVVGIRADALPSEQQVRRLQMEKSLLIQLRGCLFDASVSVREELIFFASQLLYSYRGALPTLRTQPIQEYISQVGREQPAKWALDETDVQVKSQLNADRPTLNALFDDVPTFETSFLTADDPAPPNHEVDPQKLSIAALAIMQGLLHDAALMLYTLYASCDGTRVNQALRTLINDDPPESGRFASESLRTMSRVASLDSPRYMSEADRARCTWNADMMRLLVLDMSNRRLEPRTPLTLPPFISPIRSTSDGSMRGHSDPANGQPPHRRTSADLTTARYQVLPSPLRADNVVCSAFRALDASVAVATANQQLSILSYESYNAQLVLLSLPLRLGGPVHDVLAINDLSEQSGLLVVDKRGGFSLMRGCWESSSTPTEAAVFSACPPPQPDRWLGVKCAYRTNTATLFYGGPISPSGDTEVHVLSLAEEQVVQRLAVSGSPELNSLVTHPSQRVLLAGFSDGVVRYYDDRQMHNQMSTVGMMFCKPSAADGGGGVAVAEAVIGAGPVAAGSGSGAAFTVVAATRSAVYIFDARKLNAPTAVYSHRQLYEGGPSSSAPFMTQCSVGTHTGLLAIAFADNTFGAYNVKGRILIDAPMLVSGYATGAGATAVPPVLPATCMAHPLRPLMTVGGDLVFLQV